MMMHITLSWRLDKLVTFFTNSGPSQETIFHVLS